MSKRGIIESVRKLGEQKNNLFIVTVASVDEVAHTCEGHSMTDNADDGSTPVNISGIKLNTNANDSLMVVPAIDSDILVLMTSNKEYYMIAWGDIKKIIIQIDSIMSLIGDSTGWSFNDGNNKGLVKLDPLITSLNKRSTRCDDIVLALTTIAAAMTAIGGSSVTGTVLGSAITSAISAIITPVTPATALLLENIKVKH